MAHNDRNSAATDSNQKLCILLSENDPDDLFIFEAAIAERLKHYHIMHVYTGHQLVELLLKIVLNNPAQEKTLPDVIIADLNSPFFELESIKEIRIYSQFSNIPLFIFSGEYNEEIKNKALSLGANGFYPKSASYHDLSHHVAELLSKTRSLTNTAG